MFKDIDLGCPPVLLQVEGRSCGYWTIEGSRSKTFWWVVGYCLGLMLMNMRVYHTYGHPGVSYLWISRCVMRMDIQWYHAYGHPSVPSAFVIASCSKISRSGLFLWLLSVGVFILTTLDVINYVALV